MACRAWRRRSGCWRGACSPLANALALAVANGALAGAPADLLPLFVHLFVAARARLGGSASSAWWPASSAPRAPLPRRSLDLARFSVALGATALLVGLGVAAGWEFLVGLPRLGRAAAAAAVALLAAGLAKLLADGLLALRHPLDPSRSERARGLAARPCSRWSRGA